VTGSLGTVRQPSWVTVVLLCLVAALTGALLVPRVGAPAQAESSEGKAAGLIAVTSQTEGDSLLYLVDTEREVILVYGFSVPSPRLGGSVRTGGLEFLAGRLYRWDALLATKREYSIKGLESLRGLRVFGPDGAQGQVEKGGR
jgi:hypothetical protein